MAFVDMVYVSYRVPAQRVRPLVPEGIPLSVSGDSVYVSVVAFRNVAIGIGGKAFVPCTFGQINVRTYGVHPDTGEEGPYFLRCAVTSSLVRAGARILGYPWELLDARSWSSSHSGGHRITLGGALDGDFLIDVETDTGNEATGRVKSEGVDDRLINLFVGFFPAGHGVAAVAVSHAHAGMKKGRAIRIEFPCLTRMGIAGAAEVATPDGVVIVDRAQFIVYLPHQIVAQGL